MFSIGDKVLFREKSGYVVASVDAPVCLILKSSSGKEMWAYISDVKLDTGVDEHEYKEMSQIIQEWLNV